MAITLALQKADGDYCQTPYALLDQELAAYLGSLSQLPALRSLADLDPYGDSALSRSLCERLLLEAQQLEVLASKQQLPAPPETVGMEGTGDPGVGEAFGWKGLTAFAAALRSVLEAASSQKAEVVAVGD
jgi:hypothetical protein